MHNYCINLSVTVLCRRNPRIIKRYTGTSYLLAIDKCFKFIMTIDLPTIDIEFGLMEYDSAAEAYLGSDPSDEDLLEVKDYILDKSDSIRPKLTQLCIRTGHGHLQSSVSIG